MHTCLEYAHLLGMCTLAWDVHMLHCSISILRHPLSPSAPLVPQPDAPACTRLNAVPSLHARRQARMPDTCTRRDALPDRRTCMHAPGCAPVPTHLHARVLAIAPGPPRSQASDIRCGNAATALGGQNQPIAGQQGRESSGRGGRRRLAQWGQCGVDKVRWLARTGGCVDIAWLERDVWGVDFAYDRKDMRGVWTLHGQKEMRGLWRLQSRIESCPHPGDQCAVHGACPVLPSLTEGGGEFGLHIACYPASLRVLVCC
eukprot:354575-Chlamydomonas_euryale.AAC.13